MADLREDYSSYYARIKPIGWTTFEFESFKAALNFKKALSRRKNLQTRVRGKRIWIYQKDRRDRGADPTAFDNIVTLEEITNFIDRIFNRVAVGPITKHPTLLLLRETLINELFLLKKK